MREDIIVIADPQIDNDSPTQHLDAISKYIWKHKPAHLVHIGDHWDFPSLSSYASPIDKEGKRLSLDLNAGLLALRKITQVQDARNKTAKKKKYLPTMNFLMGNHENRLNRFLDNNPVLTGFINLNSMIELCGWTVHEMNDPLFINEVCFSHYMENPQSGRPVGGAIENKLNKFPHSFVHGHQQQFQYGRRQNLLGKPHFGVCAGSFYIHDESYRGANNTEIRGFVHLRAFTNRYGYLDYDVEFISLERLLEVYGD